MSRKSKRGIIVSDIHCGHEVGLTPPKWNPQYPEFPELQKMSDYRSYLWDRFAWGVKEYGPYDVCIANGDLIDGRGEKIGGTEEIFVDREQQVEMAVDVLETIPTKELYITRGTDYHVGPYENFEDGVGKALNAIKVGDVLNIDIGGVLFNARHHLGGSQSVIGRATALLRDETWNVLWAANQDFPRADVIIRSHNHYYIAVDQPKAILIGTPGLQGYGTRYGERRLSGEIHFGFIVFEVAGKGDVSWRKVIFQFPHPPISVSEV